MRSDRPVRILRVIDRLNVGGPTKHVTWLSAGLDPERFETTLVTGTIAPGEGDMIWFARQAGVAPLVIPAMSRALGPGDLAVVWRLFRLMRRLRPDVVHTHKAKAGAVGRAAALCYRATTRRPVRVVHTFHGHVFHGYYGRLATRAFVAIERALARWATDRIVTISPRQRDEILGRYRVGRAGQVAVVPLGLEPLPPGDRRPLRTALGVPDGEVLVGAVGRLCEVKNFPLLLASVARLVAAGERVRLAIVGDGHLAAELEARAKVLGLGERVRFLGFRDDMADVYAACDVVALTSLNEGTPLTLLEAMGAGRPVAATAVGGVLDIMGASRGAGSGFAIWEHGVTAPSGDADGFAAGLQSLIRQPDLRAAMGMCGRAFVHGHMGRERLVGDIEALYDQLVGWRQGEEEGVEDAGADHGRRRVHRVASLGALSRAWGRGLRHRRSVDGVDRQHPRAEGASALHLPGR